MPSRKLRSGSLGIDAPDAEGRITASADIPGHPGWRIEIRLVPQMAAYVVDDVHVFAPDGVDVPPGGITQQVLRSLPLQAIKDDLGRQVRFLDGDLFVERFIDADAVRAMRRQASQHPRRAGRPDRYYAELADAYIAICQSSRSPIVDLAKRLRLAQITVRDGLAEARRRGLLRSAGPGRAGGELTDYGRQILKEDQ